jgi:hypothetical protein
MPASPRGAAGWGAPTSWRGRRRRCAQPRTRVASPSTIKIYVSACYTITTRRPWRSSPGGHRACAAMAEFAERPPRLLLHRVRVLSGGRGHGGARREATALAAPPCARPLQGLRPWRSSPGGHRACCPTLCASSSRATAMAELAGWPPRLLLHLVCVLSGGRGHGGARQEATVLAAPPRVRPLRGPRPWQSSLGGHRACCSTACASSPGAATLAGSLSRAASSVSVGRRGDGTMRKQVLSSRPLRR